MNYSVAVEKTFSAAHALRGYRGKCERLHGHTWKVRTVFSGTRLNKLGMLADFTEIKALLDEILAAVDHRYINEVPPFDTINPTAENIAMYIYKQLAAKPRIFKGVRLAEVTVWESETSSATVHP